MSSEQKESTAPEPKCYSNNLSIDLERKTAQRGHSLGLCIVSFLRQLQGGGGVGVPFGCFSLNSTEPKRKKKARN